MVRAGSCRGPLPGRVTGAPCRVAASLPAIQKLYRDIELLLRVFRAHCCACRSAPLLCPRALLRRIAALLCCIVSQRSPPQPRYKILCRAPPLARPCARACCLTPLRVGRPYRGLSRPYRGTCSTVLWPSPSCVLVSPAKKKKIYIYIYIFSSFFSFFSRTK